MTTSQKAAYAAFAWSLIFLVPHVYWALGGTAGFEGEPFEGILAAINIVAIFLSIIAAALALALVRPWGATLPPWLLLVGAWGACVLLSLRGIVGLIQDVVFVLGEGEDDLPTILLIFEPLFLVGGILFGLAAWRYQRPSAT